MSREDFDAADRVLARCPQPYPQQLIESIGLLHVVRERWAPAAQALGQVPRPTQQIRTLRRYAANMADLQEHRPRVYGAVVSCDCIPSAASRSENEPGNLTHHQQSSQYQIDTPTAGVATIVRVGPDGRVSPVIHRGPPRAHLQAVHRVMDQAQGPTVCYGLAGIGDGHVLAQFLSRNPPDPLGIEIPMCVVEPDAQLVRAVLMLHDLSGDDGPIRRQRVRWYVGLQWPHHLEADLRDDPFMVPPTHIVPLTPEGRAVVPAINQIVARVAQEGQDRYDEADKAYASRSPDRWASILRGQAGRQPRVMLVTSRFTTVLQHAIGDVAQAFEQLGWQTTTLIEPSEHQRVTSRAIHEILSRFSPDLIFTIDHLRRGFGTSLPDALPVVTWIQDDLNHLISPDAGRSVGVRDFVLTAAPGLYADSFGYPLRQCLYLDKLTRVPSRPAIWTSDGDDLVFVSNASMTPQAIIDQFMDEVGGDGVIREMVGRCCRRITEVYARHRCLYSPKAVVEIIHRACQESNMSPLDPVKMNQLALRLFNGLNNTLYRQQAIRWATEVADELGLSLALYGAGWEDNPDFARHARGPVAYGHDLEELTRRSKINLQIVPFSCLHQRLLDGLVAGGFFLIREHPFDRLHRELSTWLKRLGPGVRSAADVVNLPEDQRHRFNELHEAVNRLTLDGDDDPIKTYRCHLEQCVDYLYDTLPGWDDVTFDTPEALRRRVETYLNRPADRAAVAQDQRDFVAATRTYEAGLKRILSQITQLIAAEPRPGLSWAG